MPLINPKTIEDILNIVSETEMGLLTVELQDPTGYGRILRDNKNSIEAIVEQKMPLQSN